MDASDKRIHANIATYGWHVMKVGTDEAPAGFAYTIGLYRSHTHPELIMLGLPLDTMHAILNVAGDLIKAGRRFRVGEETDALLDRHKCTFRYVPPRRYDDFLGGARWYYKGASFPVLQVIWPDRRGRYPWSDTASEAFRTSQPVLVDGD